MTTRTSPTLKVFTSSTTTKDGEAHTTVTLAPDSSDPKLTPLVFSDVPEGELRLVAELVTVLS